MNKSFHFLLLFTMEMFCVPWGGGHPLCDQVTLVSGYYLQWWDVASGGSTALWIPGTASCHQRLSAALYSPRCPSCHNGGQEGQGGRYEHLWFCSLPDNGCIASLPLSLGLATVSTGHSVQNALSARPALCAAMRGLLHNSFPTTETAGAAVNVRLHLWLLPLSFLHPVCLPCLFSMPVFICLSVWISRIYLCIEQVTLCWIIVV